VKNTDTLDNRRPFTCEFGHKQVNKCRQGHPVYSHNSRWCCACEADIAFALKWIQEEPEFRELLTLILSCAPEKKRNKDRPSHMSIFDEGYDQSTHDFTANIRKAFGDE
jgi:hypothetical protein